MQNVERKIRIVSFREKSIQKRQGIEMKVAFLTLGCKVNYYETEKMTADFIRHGFEITDFQDDADVYVINTCTVTNIADRKSRKMIHRAKKRNPNSLVVAVGCYVESSQREQKTDEAVDVALSNKDKEGIAEKVLVYLREAGKEGITKRKDEGIRDQQEPHTDSGRTRKYIKIQDGCNQFCSYCTIPYVRGGGVLSSREPEEVTKEVRLMAEQGCKEVVLTGIHLSSYGVDRSTEKQFVKLKGAPLVELLQRLEDIRGLERIRLGSLEPRIIGKEFLDGLSKVSKLCPHFHLSLQSGCDATLKRMNRHYTSEEYREKCGMLRSYYEHPAITTDVIVGFPGETEEEFETTRQFVRAVGLADIHVFPYSIRNGTKAAKMPDQVLPQIRRRRSDQLIGDAEQLQKEYRAWFSGRTENILFEEVRRIQDEEYLVGHNERYVLFGVPLKEALEKGYAENEIVRIEVGNRIF